MISKPEIFNYIEEYSGKVESEYNLLSERLGTIETEMLNTLIEYTYKQGMKDGFLLHAELDTN